MKVILQIEADLYPKGVKSPPLRGVLPDHISVVYSEKDNDIRFYYGLTGNNSMGIQSAVTGDKIVIPWNAFFDAVKMAGIEVQDESV